MKNWTLIILVVMLGLFACTTNKTVQVNEKVEKDPINTKVAILPIKSLDSPSRYISKILSVRDLSLTFDKYSKYVLLDMEETAAHFKQSGYSDVEELEVSDVKEIFKGINADVLMLSTVSENRNGTYAISMRLFSNRSDDLKQINFNVGKERTGRWKTLDETMMKDLDAFVSNEMDKIFNIATNFYNNENYTDAEKTFKQVVALKPDKKDAYFYLGKTYVKLNNPVLAEQNYVKARELDPQDERYITDLAKLYEDTNQPAKRLVLLEQLALTKNDEELWLAVGNLYYQQGDAVKAKEAFMKALTVDPDYTTANIRLGFILYDEKNYNEAITYLEKAFDQQPDNDILSKKLATSYQLSGRINDAIARYEALLKTDANNVNAYLNVIGLYRNAANDTSDAKAKADLYKKALDKIAALKKIAPNNEYVYLNLAAIYFAQGKYAEAETNANLTIQNNSALYQPYQILAGIFHSRGREAYNRYVDLDKQIAKAIGSKAQKLKTDRDAAKASATSLLRTAETNYRKAANYATDQDVIADINREIGQIGQTLNQMN